MIENQVNFNNLNAWPYIEAIKILNRINGKIPKKGYVLFECGYGPSGPPHIGTFAEVMRTTFVQKAFENICDIPTKLICFSDDLDGLRKVPSNVPQQDMLKNYIGYPLTSIPDPYGVHESYGAAMNAKLKSFLDHFGFDYEFLSATEVYRSGLFDPKLIEVLEKYDDIMNIMLPSLRTERRSTYSPFMPVCKETGMVLQVPIIKVDKISKTIFYKDINNVTVETEVTGGQCKLQWKPDFAMRWAALDVDYEMYGKDHMPNSGIYSSICETLDNKPPVQFFYELFLNEDGNKISKSKGNGITIDDWLKYAPIESLSLYIYQSPAKAKRLHFDVIPKSVDEYLLLCNKYKSQNDMQKLENPVSHIHNNNVPEFDLCNISFGLLLNLASACNPENATVLLGFITKYAQNINIKDPYLTKLVDCAINYYNNFVKSNKIYIAPNDMQIGILKEISTSLKNYDNSVTSEEIQNMFYSIGNNYYSDLKIYFSDLYQILLGQKEGPRFGSFTKLYGLHNMISLIESKI